VSDRSAAPLRFVWRTDADAGSVRCRRNLPRSSASRADVIGRRFKTWQFAFGLDAPARSRLLDGADSWSGRSVLWPAPGTDLKILRSGGAAVYDPTVPSKASAVSACPQRRMR